jgi:hypothetical protein
MSKCKKCKKKKIVTQSISPWTPPQPPPPPPPPLPTNDFCICCHFMFMNMGNYAGFYTHDCVHDTWVAYFGHPNTPITTEGCSSPWVSGCCPPSCINSPTGGPSMMLSVNPEPVLVWQQGDYAVHDDVRESGLKDNKEFVGLSNSDYHTKELERFLAVVKLPDGGSIYVELVQIVITSKSKDQKKGILRGPSKIFGFGWEVEQPKENVVVKVKRRQVELVGNSGSMTRCLWLHLLDGDFQVLTNTDIEVP